MSEHVEVLRELRNRAEMGVRSAQGAAESARPIARADALDAAIAALSAPAEAQPVGYLSKGTQDGEEAIGFRAGPCYRAYALPDGDTPLYAHPPPSTPVGVTHAEREVIETLLDLAYAAWSLADSSEDAGGEGLTVERSDFAVLEKHLDTLSDLPDDRPGHTLGEAAKARWALRRLLSHTTPLGAPVGVELPEGYRVAEHLPGIWEYQFDIQDEADEDSDRRVSGTSWNHPAIAAIAAWSHAYDALSQQPAAVDEFAEDRNRLLRAFMQECGVIGPEKAGVNLARGIKAALASHQGGRDDE